MRLISAIIQLILSEFTWTGEIKVIVDKNVHANIFKDQDTAISFVICWWI